MFNEDDLSVNDFGKICRTCLEEGEMKYLYDRNPHKKYSLKNMLLSITYVQFSENDALPVQICVKCELELMRAYSFSQKCAQADKILRACLKDYNDKINNKTKTFSSQPAFSENILNSSSSTNEELCRFEYTEPENEFEIKTEIEIEEHTTDIYSDIFINKREILEKKLPDYNNEQLHENKSGNNDAMQYENGGNFEFIAVNTELSQDKFINSDEKNENVPNKSCVIVIPDNDSDTISVDGVSNEEYSDLEEIHEQSNCTEIQKQETEKTYGQIEEQSNSTEIQKQETEKTHGQIEEQSNSTEIQKQEETEETYGQINEQSTSKEIQNLQETEESYECRRCFEKFATFDLLRQHRLDVNHPSRLNCKICAKLITANNMVAHMKIHNKDMSFFCEICGKGFFRERYLTWHLATHTGEKPYKCDICNKRFPYEVKLKEHSRIHSDQKRHVCDNCGKRFHVKRNLIRHMRIHTGERPFTCNFCERGFIQKISLDVHLRTHTGERPAVCEHCGKRFTSNGLLNWHMKIHQPSTRNDLDSTNLSKKTRGGVYCAYFKCDNNSRNSKLSFFRFPKDERCSVWIQNSGRKELSGMAPEDWYMRYRLCSKHFDNSMFANFQRTRLLSRAVPIMFSSDDVGK